MTKEREALKLTMAALKKYHYAMIDAGVLDRQEVLDEGFTAFNAAKEALAQPEPPPPRQPLTEDLLGLLKEARKIIRASSSRNLVKHWDARATSAIAAHNIKE